MKLCIAIPYYGPAHALFFRCIQDLIAQPPCALAMVDIVGDSLIPRGRNTLIWKFLETDCDAVLFIDSDIIFTPAHVSRILSHDIERYPCIGGVYPKKKVAPTWVLNTFEGGPNTADSDGLLSVKYTGTGFMLITRKVLEEIQERWPERAYAADSDEAGDKRFDFFPIGPRNIIIPDAADIIPGAERYLSEDWAFCELVRALGYSVQVDTSIRLEHMGQVNFPIAADEVLPRSALNEIHIGRRTQEFLTNVAVFESKPDPETGQPARRLIDVDQLAHHIAPPVAASPPPVAPPLVQTAITNSNAA